MKRQQRRSGGPKTDNGKSVTSKNAITHGCCSKQLLVGDEKPEDFEALRTWWFDSYEAELAGRPLIEEALLNEWLLRRAQRNQLAVEAGMGPAGANEWTEEQWHRLQLMMRYKTGAERSFHRSLGALERFRRTRYYEDLAEERAEQRAEGQEKQRRREEKEEKKPKEAPQPSTAERYLALPPATPTPALSQWITVDVVDGATVTTMWPSNEELRVESETMEPRPLRVFRDLLIRNWKAPEYGWVAGSLPGEGSTRLQVMRVEEWKRAVEREEAQGGHLGPVETDESWWRRREIYAGGDEPRSGKTRREREQPGAGGPGAMGGGPGEEREGRDEGDAEERPAA